MSDILGGLGSAAEGGLFARALEPDSGAREPHPDQPDKCLNCGTPLTGAYCHACGQQGHIHRTIGAFMHDLLHGALHFEGKLWRTLPLLAFKPGKLTRRYIEGERARFVSPMALFLFGVFLMFAVFQMLGFTTPTDISGDEVIGTTIEDAREEAVAEIALTQERLASDGMTAAERATAEERVATLEHLLENAPDDETALLQEYADGLMNGTRSDNADAAPSDGSSVEDSENTAVDDMQEPVVRASLSDGSDQKTGIGFIDGVIAKWTENPGLMLYKLQANAYKFSWLLIPISIPFVWLLFLWKRRFCAYDHAIFVTYSLSFMTLLFIFASVVGLIGVPTALSTLAVLLIPPIHLYKQLRGTYEIGRLSAFWRLLVLSAFIWIVIALFVQLLLLLGTL